MSVTDGERTGGRPPRVLLVETNEDGTTGGSHRALHDLVHVLDRERWDPVVAFHQDNPFAEALREAGFEVHVLDGMRETEQRVRRGGSAAERLLEMGVRSPLRRARLLRRLRIDLLQLNNSPGVGNDDWLPGAWLAGVPALTFASGNARTTAPAWHRFLSRRFHRVLAVSPEVEESWRAMGIPAGRMTRTGVGLDVAAFRARIRRSRDEVRTELGIPADAPVGLMVGNLREWKGQQRVVEAFARIPGEEVPGLWILFAGDTAPADRPWAEALRKRVDAAGLGDRIRFLGARTDVPDLLAAADFAIHASLQPEPFGLVIVEAMALGLPVLAASLGAPRWIVTPDSGRTFDPHDPGVLADHLRAFADPDIRRRHSSGSRLRAEAFDIRLMAGRVEAVWEEILRDRSVGSPRAPSPGSR